jgi:hypothetical protein
MARLRGIARFWQAEMKMTCIEEKVSVYTDESNMTRGTASHLFCSFLLASKKVVRKNLLE